MSVKTIGLSESLYEYLLSVSVHEPEVLQRLREQTQALPMAIMQISPEQGQFMRLLVELLDVRRALEIGTFTGYSALCVALAMADEGRLLCCDTSEEWTAIAQTHWREAGVADKIDLRIAPALQTLDALLAEGGAGQYDFAFIDADKQNYSHYYERCLELLRVGGLIAVDNTLWSGAVADANNTEASTRAIRAFNAQLYDDARVSLSLLPVGDGLTLARKR